MVFVVKKGEQALHIKKNTNIFTVQLHKQKTLF